MCSLGTCHALLDAALCAVVRVDAGAGAVVVLALAPGGVVWVGLVRIVVEIVVDVVVEEKLGVVTFERFGLDDPVKMNFVVVIVIEEGWEVEKLGKLMMVMVTEFVKDLSYLSGRGIYWVDGPVY
eukprot:Pgem_evm1s4217